MSLLIKIVIGVVAPTLLALIAFAVRDVFRKMSGSAIIFGLGLLGLFMGERVFGDSGSRALISAASLVVIIAAIGLRAYAWTRSEGGRKAAHFQGLIFTGVAFGSLFLYVLSTDGAVGAMGLSETAGERWSDVLYALFPIGILLGSIPTLMLDRVLALHPVVLPEGTAKRAVISGLTTALAIALVFPVNYLAAEHKQEWDLAYFKTTRPGESTQALVASLPEPVTATLFFAPGSDVKEKMLPYFEQLQSSSGGQFTVNVVDQPLAPKLAQEVKVRENGYVALQMGEAVEKFKIGTEMKKAKRELRKLDGTVQKHLLKITKGDRTVYLLTGHGEASAREKENPLRKTNLFKKLLQNQNYKVKNFGAADGSTDAVPDDAALVAILAPEEPLLPEEVKALSAYVQGGGKLLVLLDPETDPLDDLLATVNLKAQTAPLAHATKFIKQRPGTIDRVNLVTNRFGSHPSVHTLSRNSVQLALVLFTATTIDTIGESDAKITPTIRTFPDTWLDLDGDREQGANEPSKAFEVGKAVEGPEENPYRVIVVGDVSLIADPVLQFSKGNQAFVYDTVRWLVGDEELAGDVESEEDVKIQHTNEDDKAAFYLAVVGVPLFILALGGLIIRLQRRKS